MNTVSIIIVGMNHLIYLKALLASIFKENNISISFEVIYIDNCSTDGSVEYIQKEYPQIKLFINNTPLGFGENNNKGAIAASGKYIAIINPDIVLKEGALDLLYNFIESHNKTGIVVPQLLNPNGTIQYSVRGFISLSKLWARLKTKGNDNSSNPKVEEYLCKKLDFNKTQAIDWAIGAAMFMRKDTFAALGGFDTDYFLYMEDEDLCLRCWKMNRSVIYYPKAQMIHNHLRGSAKLGRKTLMHLNSMKTFFLKHGFNIKSFANRKEQQI